MSIEAGTFFPEPLSTLRPEITLEPRDQRILASGKVPFSDFTEVFRTIFQSRPDTTFEIYNPSPIFTNPPGSYRAVRVDSSEGATKSIIFKRGGGKITPYLKRTFDLEDPFATNIDGEIIFGGVQVDKSVDEKGQRVSKWRTILFRGRTIPELRQFFVGPEGMKDIRPVQRPNGRIGVYTRPRNPGNEAFGGDGQIGYREFSSLDKLEQSPSSVLEIDNAPLLSFRFPRDQWGGVNHPQVVKDGKYEGWNLLLIHRAHKDNAGQDQNRHYSADTLLHNPDTSPEVIDLGTLVKRSDLPEGPWKDQDESDDLRDVYFPGELKILDKWRALAVGGMSDAETGWALVLNPLAMAP